METIKAHWREHFEAISRTQTDEEWHKQKDTLVRFLTSQKLLGVLPEIQDIKMEILREVDRLRPTAESDRAKLALMRLLGEDKIYVNEYNACRERVEARERCRSRREARRRSSNTKESASTS